MFKFKKDEEFHLDERLSSIAFIMDGNGRWAKKRGLPRSAGHRKGAETFVKLVKFLGKAGAKYITVYAFSTENWKRPREEVDTLMQIFTEYIDRAIDRIGDNDIRVIFLGDKTPLPERLRGKCLEIEKKSEKNTRILNIALNYGGRDEIVRAVNAAHADGIERITEEVISRYLYTRESPDPDLVIRTGGEMRTSNFLMWQSAYSEYYFTDTLWPDLSEREIKKIVSDFYRRNRRYGGL